LKMKMKYLPRSRYQQGYSKRALFLVLIFLIGAIFFSLFDNLITRAISPLWRAENRFSRSLLSIGGFFASRESLREENVELKDRIASLELEVSAATLYRSESERLLALLGRVGEEGGITASVLTHPPQSPYDLIVIDAGERDRVTVGAKVYLPEGPEMGVVTQIFPSFSRVKLLTSPGEKTQAVLERHDVPVELEGMGGGSFKIVLPRETEVVVGDRILSGNLKSSLVAVVADITLTPTDAFKEVIAKSPANIFTLRYITIRP
jgi:cell shape-determining protein MreC